MMMTTTMIDTGLYALFLVFEVIHLVHAGYYGTFNRFWGLVGEERGEEVGGIPLLVD